MTQTNFPGGISSLGVPIVPGMGHLNPFATHYFVDGNRGSDGNQGTDKNFPLLTMAAAFLKLASGDVIHWRGNITEQIDTPVGIFDVTLIAASNRPRHADAHTGNNGYSSSTWKPPGSPAATTPLLRIRQQGWRLIGGLFDPPADSSAIRIFRDGGSGDAERDASHAWIQAARIVGGSLGIEGHGGPGHVLIEDCEFHDLTTAILNTTGAGIGQPGFRWVVRQNRFRANTNHIVIAAQEMHIYENYMGSFTTQSIDLDGGVGKNLITRNYLSGAYSVAGGYRRAAADDEWAGNENSGGATTADPA